MTVRLRVLVVLLVSLVAVAGCGAGDTAVAVGSTAEGAPSRAVPAGDPSPTPAPFTLYVSNQSFEDPTVRITITIDGEVVVDGDFDVEGQHNWSTFHPELAPGDHTLHAVSSTGAELTTELTIPEGEPRWAVADYWHDPGEGRRFTFHFSATPIAFA